jgi:two-component system cell cycle response regulator
MNKEDLLSIILVSAELPTLPTVASELITLICQEDATLSDVADLISQDVAISTKILKVCNSAFYNFPEKIGSVQQAVVILGANAVRSLVLSFSFLTPKKGGKDHHFDFELFWERSLARAVSSKMILEKIPGANTEDIFLVGLLQNMGELILACTLPGEYRRALAERHEKSIEVQEAELSIFGADHCYVGYEVAEHWNFPASITLPILHHHKPREYTGNDIGIGLSTKAVYLSDLLVKIHYSDQPNKYHRLFRSEAKKLLGLKSIDIDRILQDTHIEIEAAADHFGLHIRDTKSIQEILQEANIRLSLMNLDYEQMNKELVKAKISLEKLAKELQKKNELLKELANVDGLTGVYNNRFFQNALDKELSRSLRSKSCLSLVLIDIDKFKHFNDTYGHLVGDYVLTEFSQLMGPNLRKYDTLARYGGEEFIVILPDTSEENAVLVAEKLRSAIEAKVFGQVGEVYHVTASFGVSCMTPNPEQEIGKTDLIKMADEALYEAKNQGRNRVVAYAPKKKWFGLK